MSVFHGGVLIKEVHEGPLVHNFMLHCGVSQLNDDFTVLGVSLLEHVPVSSPDVQNLFEEFQSFWCQAFVEVELRLQLDRSPNEIVLQGPITELDDDRSLTESLLRSYSMSNADVTCTNVDLEVFFDCRGNDVGSIFLLGLLRQ